MPEQSPVPRGHCRTIDRGDPETGALYTHCVCGAPYEDTIIAAELTRMARTLTEADDLPDIGRAKPPGITPEAAASVLGYERARAMGATTNVRIDPVDFQADPTGAIRAARERGSVVLTDDDGKPRMRIGAPLRSDTVPDDVRALLTEAKAALEACADGRGPFVCGNATMGGNGEIAGLYALGCHACAATTPDDETDACIAEAVAITVRARAAAKAIGEALATAPNDPADRGRHASPSHVELWNAIDEYVSSCGVVDLSRTSDRRMTAVARVERAVDAIARKRMTEDAALRAALDARAPRDYAAFAARVRETMRRFVGEHGYELWWSSASESIFGLDLDSTKAMDLMTLSDTSEAVHAANRAIATPIQSEPANDGPALQTTHAPSYEAGWRDALAKVRAIWQRWMDDDSANDVDAMAEIAGLFDDDDTNAPVTLADLDRWATEYSATLANPDAQAASGYFVGWVRKKVKEAGR